MGSQIPRTDATSRRGPQARPYPLLLRRGCRPFQCPSRRRGPPGPPSHLGLPLPDRPRHITLHHPPHRCIHYPFCNSRLLPLLRHHHGDANLIPRQPIRVPLLDARLVHLSKDRCGCSQCRRSHGIFSQEIQRELRPPCRPTDILHKDLDDYAFPPWQPVWKYYRRHIHFRHETGLSTGCPGPWLDSR